MIVVLSYTKKMARPKAHYFVQQLNISDQAPLLNPAAGKLTHKETIIA